MKKRIFSSILLCAMTVLLLGLLVSSVFSYSYFEEIQSERLRSDLMRMAAGVELSGLDYLQAGENAELRVTWVATDGTVLYDSAAEAAQMENHGQREEIQTARKAGYGESVRYSTTMTRKTIYHAMRLSDGTVLRSSVSQDTVFVLILGVIPWLLLAALVTALASYAIAAKLTARIIEPMSSLDLEHPLENDCYEELSPLLTRIYRQNEQIGAHMAELRQREEEFRHITACMKEGLVLLDADEKVLSMNAAACQLFGVETEPVGIAFCHVDRSRQMRSTIREAVEQGAALLQREKDGHCYQLEISRIDSDGSLGGLVLLAMDVSQKEQAERSRREFTANVSHELKTPLTTIMASAELIENGMVKSEDMPRFVGHIRHEAARLLNLIEDIIRLSRLDEGHELCFEELALHQAAEDCVEQYRTAAEIAKVSLAFSGEECTIRSDAALLNEIIGNLVENAIKYNVPNGRVQITVSKQERGGLLIVEDTGIGIPAEYQERVFERFFRVDKSHSRQTGGTGLGLSIVKHAVSCVGAELSLDSEPGRGTSVQVFFPSEEPKAFL